MRELDNLLKRFAQGEAGRAVAKENFEHGKDILLRRTAAIEGLFDTRRWDTTKYVKHREELLEYFSEACQLMNYKALGDDHKSA
jgi:hypothetical protein